jgi:hypothetical protein
VVGESLLAQIVSSDEGGFRLSMREAFTVIHAKAQVKVNHGIGSVVQPNGNSNVLNVDPTFRERIAVFSSHGPLHQSSRIIGGESDGAAIATRGQLTWFGDHRRPNR